MRNVGSIVKGAAALIGGLGLLTTAVAQVSEIEGLLERHLWPLLSIAWVLLTAALWPGPERRRKRRTPNSSVLLVRQYGGVAAATIAVLCIGSWRLWEVRRASGPSGSLHLQGADLSEPRTLLTPPPLTLRPDAPPQVVQFMLDTRKTVYSSEPYEDEPLKNVEVWGIRSLGGGDDDYERGIDYWHKYVAPNVELSGPNEEFLTSFALRRRCRSFLQTTKTREALRRFVSRSDRAGLAKYIEGDLSTLAIRRQDIVAKLMPTDAEWASVRAAGDEEAILGWIDNCVGLPYPVVLVTLANPNGAAAVVSAVRYWVIDSQHSCAAGDTPELLWPVFRYRHGIPPHGADVEQERWVAYPAASRALRRYLAERDESRDYTKTPAPVAKAMVPPPTEYALAPAVAIPARGNVSFELLWFLDARRNRCSCSQGGHRLLLSVELITSAGSVRTPEFFFDGSPVGSTDGR